MSGMGELFSFGLTRAIFFAMCGTEQSVGALIGNIYISNNFLRANLAYPLCLFRLICLI